MIVTTEAIVLRARKQGETSKIVTLYTREYGKLNAIAKGARELKSKFGGALEMFTHVSAVIYKREKADALNLLSKAETISGNRGIIRSLKKMEPATEIVELLLHAMHDEEANSDLFSHLEEAFQAISNAPEAQAPFLAFGFYLAFARAMGFEIDLSDRSTIPGKWVEFLRPIADGNFDGYTEKDIRQFHAFFQSYFAEHLPGVTLRGLKSAKVFERL